MLQHADKELSSGCFVVSSLSKEAMGKGFTQTFCRNGTLKDCVPLGSYRQSWCVCAALSCPELRQRRKRDECR